MLGNAFGWPHLIIILAVILLLFGATRLPALSRSLGQSIKIFRKEVKSDLPEDDNDDDAADDTSDSTSGRSGSAKSGGSSASKSGGTSSGKK